MIDTQEPTGFMLTEDLDALSTADRNLLRGTGFLHKDDEEAEEE